MKKKFFLIAVFILIGFIYIQNRSSETAHLEKAWKKTMNASSGRITYTVKIIDHGPDFGKTENTITIIDFMEKDDKFFYERNVYYEDSMELKQTDKVSDDGNFIIIYPEGSDVREEKEPIDEKLSLKYLCGGDLIKLNSKFIESVDCDSSKNTYDISFNYKNNHTKPGIADRKIKVEVNEELGTVDKITDDIFMVDYSSELLELLVTREYDLHL